MKLPLAFFCLEGGGGQAASSSLITCQPDFVDRQKELR